MSSIRMAVKTAGGKFFKNSNYKKFDIMVKLITKNLTGDSMWLNLMKIKNVNLILIENEIYSGINRGKKGNFFLWIWSIWTYYNI